MIICEANSYSSLFFSFQVCYKHVFFPLLEFLTTEDLDSNSPKVGKGLGLIETCGICEYVNTNSRTATTVAGSGMTSKINIERVRQCDA